MMVHELPLFYYNRKGQSNYFQHAEVENICGHSPPFAARI